MRQIKKTKVSTYRKKEDTEIQNAKLKSIQKKGAKGSRRNMSMEEIQKNQIRFPVFLIN